MNSLRLIILTIIGWLAYRLIRRIAERAETPSNRQPAGTRMVRCAWCELYIPEQDALNRDDACFCSEEHYQQMISMGKK